MIFKYLKNILISIDQLFNTIFGGDPDETLSSRIGKKAHGTILEKIINFIFGDNHCIDAIEKDEGKDSII